MRFVIPILKSLIIGVSILWQFQETLLRSGRVNKMCFKKIMEGIEEMELDNKIILFVFLIIGMFAGIIYTGALIVPNWDIFIKYTWAYQAWAYFVICLVLVDLIFIIIITLKTAINNQVLIKINKDLGIEISTGSLGMGLSIGVGCALAAKLDKNEKKYIYIILGDGELDQGAIWEAAMAASHYKLDNLIAIVDRNGIQSDGSTEEIMALEPLAEKWKAFGWEVMEVDGANIVEMIQSLNKAKTIIRKPKVIISYFIKGADVSFMEHTRKYHGRPPNKEEYNQAINEIENIEKTLNEA